MSALSTQFIERTSATTTTRNAGEGLFLNFRLVNKVMDALCDVDLYESPEELKPTGSAIIAAANTLKNMSPESIENVEIEPYSGELSLIWKSGRDKRVKAMFGQEPKSYSVYYEKMANGRVVERCLNTNATDNYLRDRLVWLNQ
jgi:hypothetical protein